MTDTQQLRVFVSHSSADDVFCREIVHALRNANADVWYDEHNLGPGVLRREIMRELAERPIFVVVLSKAAFSSSWVQDECEWAYNLYRRKPERLMLPIIAAPCDLDDFNALLYLESLKRIEAGNLQPYSVEEAANRLLHALALIPTNQVSAPTPPQSIESAEDLLTRGQALNAQNNYAEALLLFERAAQLAPGSFGVWFNLGLVRNELNRFAEALPAHDRATTLNPSSAAAWSNKGVALRNLGRTDEALSAYDRALTLDPNSMTTWLNRGIALGSLEHHAEAAAAFDHVLANDPNLAQAWYNKGVALSSLEDYQGALAAFDHALALTPDLATAWLNKGMALAYLGDYQKALDAFDNAITLEPTMWAAWLGKSAALQGLGRVEEADMAERHANELQRVRNLF